MNLLAAGASFGLIVAIFQWGWGSEALGIGKGAPIEAWAPVMFFAILFGLSMDYQVFLVSRMPRGMGAHPRQPSGDHGRPVRDRGIITAAAFIMITVFFGFILDPNRGVKPVRGWPGQRRVPRRVRTADRARPIDDAHVR